MLISYLIAALVILYITRNDDKMAFEYEWKGGKRTFPVIWIAPIPIVNIIFVVYYIIKKIEYEI